MTRRPDIQGEMPVDPLSDEDADMLLSGHMAPADAPPGWAGVAAAFQVACGPSTDDELAGMEPVVAACMQAVGEAPCPAVHRSSKRPSRVLALTPWTAAAGVVALFGATAAAAAGYIPGPALLFPHHPSQITPAPSAPPAGHPGMPTPRPSAHAKGGIANPSAATGTDVTTPATTLPVATPSGPASNSGNSQSAGNGSHGSGAITTGNGSTNGKAAGQSKGKATGQTGGSGNGNANTSQGNGNSQHASPPGHSKSTTGTTTPPTENTGHGRGKSP